MSASLIAKVALRRSKRLLKGAIGPLVRHYAKRSSLPPAQWDLQVTPEGLLQYEGIALPPLLERWGSPLHVVQGSRLRRNVKDFLSQNLPGEKPRCEVFYSYKTNPIPGVLRLMHSLGVGAEVISAYELWLAFSLGVAPENIIYNGPVKSDASIKEALSRDILLINVNHREEVERLSQHAKALSKTPRVGVRVGTKEAWAGQFGSAIATGEAFTTAQAIVAAGNLRLCALHTHLGGSLRSAGQLERFVSEALGFADELRERLGIEVEILDFGGSLANPTVATLSEQDRKLNSALQTELTAPDPDATLSIREYTRLLVAQVSAHYEKLSKPLPRIVVEPGRAMTGNTQVLLSQVHSVKAGQEGPDHLLMDAGINLAECVRYEFHQIFPANRMNEAKARSYRLAGPICSPGDVLCASWSAPVIQAGDCLAIMDAGAYFVPFATSFSFPQPAIVLVDEGKEILLRRAERYEDLVSLDNPGQEQAHRLR